MPNTNTIAAFQLLNQGNVTSESAFASASGGSVRALLTIPSPIYTPQFDGRNVRLRVIAKVTGGTTTNYTMKVYGNYGGNTNLTTFTNDINIMTSGALAVNSATRIIVLDGIVYWDSTSQRLIGEYGGVTDAIGGSAAVIARAALANPGTSLTTAAAAFAFFVTGLFSATSAGNAATLTTFELDVV